MSTVLIIVAAAALTWTMRASFITLAGRWQLPGAVEETLTLARPAVLAALVGTALVGNAGDASALLRGPELIAAAVTAFVAWRTGHLLLTLLAGSVAIALLTIAWPA